MDSPANPTGAVFNRATAEALLELARRHNLWVLSDEVYDELSFAGPQMRPAALDSERVAGPHDVVRGLRMTFARRRLAVVPRESFGDRAHGLVRISLGVDTRTLLAGIERLTKVVLEVGRLERASSAG